MFRLGHRDQGRKQRGRCCPHSILSAPEVCGKSCFAGCALCSCVQEERLASPVSQGIELGVADDMVFGRVDSKRTGGSVGLLSGGLIDRTAYYEHAMILALVPFMECNKDLF